MCTAISYKTKDCYFGRNLDLDCSYGEEVCILPRKFPLHFRQMGERGEHFAIIGMATIVKEIPLFYDATNEYGLSMAGLNFPQNAYYAPSTHNKDNVAPFEFIPWILGQCKSVAEARLLLKNVNLVDMSFSENLPNSPLHWMIADKVESIVVESMQDGLHIYDNPVGVLTNNPPFPFHVFNLNHYRNLKTENGESTFAKEVALENFCQGLGAVGLPGDVSSTSRFVRAVFYKENSVCKEDEVSSVSQFFHILSSVEMVQGGCKTQSGKLDITVYSACININRGLYYYTTYNNRQINRIDMYKTDLNGKSLIRYPLKLEGGIVYQN